jgi:hypothetical protein
MIQLLLAGVNLGDQEDKNQGDKRQLTFGDESTIICMVDVMSKIRVRYEG